MDVDGTAAVTSIESFLADRFLYGGDEEENFKNLNLELEKKRSLLRKQHVHQVKQIEACKAVARKLVQTGFAWAQSLGTGANAANSDDYLGAAALVRNLDGRLLSLGLAGYAEIEYRKERLRRQALFNQNLADSLLYYAEQRKQFTEFISRLDHDTNYVVQVRPLPRNDPQFKRCKRAVEDNVHRATSHYTDDDDVEDVQIQQIYQIHHKTLLSRFQQHLRRADKPQIKGLFCPISSACVERAITLGLGTKSDALRVEDVFQKCWFRVIDEAQSRGDNSKGHGGRASCMQIVQDCDDMPTSLVFSRYSNFGPDDNMTPRNDSTSKFIVLCRVILDNVHTAEGNSDEVPTLSKHSPYGAILQSSSKKYVVKNAAHAALPEFLIQYVSPKEMIHRLDPSARKPPPTYIVPSQAMVTDMYMSKDAPSHLDTQDVPRTIGASERFKQDTAAAMSTVSDDAAQGKSRSHSSPSSSPMRLANPIALPAPRKIMPTAPHAQPHQVLSTNSTSCIPSTVVNVVRAEDERRRKLQLRNLFGAGHDSGSKASRKLEQGAVCDFPQVKHHESAVQAADVAQDDIVEGLRQNLRTVKAEIKKSVNAAIAVKSERVKAKHKGADGEPREIEEIKQLAKEMTSLREELWRLKSQARQGTAHGNRRRHK